MEHFPRRYRRRSFCLASLLGALLVNAMASTAGPNYNLPPCPSSPNCVSSQAADNHFIKTFPLTGNAEEAFDGLRKILQQRQDTTIVATDDGLIRVEFKTTLGFVDDGLFVLDKEDRAIQVRSGSRLGHWDFGKNRRRMEDIRRQFQHRMGMH